MKKKLSASLIVCLMVAVVVGDAAARPAQAFGGYHFGFEETTKPFIAKATQNMAASLSRVYGYSACAPTLQNHYARLVSQAAITVAPGAAQATWIVASLPVAQGEADSVTISWSARADGAKIDNSSGGSCSNCLATAYAGTAAPQRAEDFSLLTKQGYMNSTWANYSFSTIVVPESANAIYVAMGWNGTGSAIDLDCVTVNIVPIVLGK